MTKLEELKILNEVKKEALKEKGKDYHIYDLIEGILNDDDCFFKLSKEEAFMILQNLDIKKDQMETIYSELKRR